MSSLPVPEESLGCWTFSDTERSEPTFFDQGLIKRRHYSGATPHLRVEWPRFFTLAEFGGDVDAYERGLRSQWGNHDADVQEAVRDRLIAMWGSHEGASLYIFQDDAAREAYEAARDAAGR